VRVGSGARTAIRARQSEDRLEGVDRGLQPCVGRVGRRLDRHGAALHQRLELYAFAGQLLDEAVAQAGDGFGAEAEGLRAAREAANEDALERARTLLDGTPPAGRRRRKRDISAIARDTGLETEAVKHAAKLMAASSSRRRRPRRRRAAAHRRR